MPSVEELQSAVTQSLEAAVDSMRFASELMTKNTAQQQEIERLRAELEVRCGELREAKKIIAKYCPTICLDLNDPPAAQRKGERPVDVEAIVQEIETETGLGPGACAAIRHHAPGILRRHLEPQGEPHERDEEGATSGQALQASVSQEPPSPSAEPQEAQAVAPASPVRAEGSRGSPMEVIDRESRYQRVIGTCLCGTCQSQIYINAEHPEGYCPNCRLIAALHADRDGYKANVRKCEAELAALRKQVEEGEKDKAILDWMEREKREFAWCDPDGRCGWIRDTLRQVVTAAMAATPEPKEPA